MNTSFFKQLIANPATKEQYLLKLQIIQLIRDFFRERKYIEIEPPILNNALIPESYLDIYQTEERRVGLDGIVRKNKYLMTSPEAFQKKLLAAGFGSNFAITRSFRNGEPLSGKHLGEFSMLEWYEQGSTYTNVMQTTEELFTYIANNLNLSQKITYNSANIDISTPWPRMSMRDLFQEFLSIDLEETWSPEDNAFSVKHLTQKVVEKNLPITVETSTTWEELFNQLFLTYVEPALPTEKPVIVMDFPHELSPLARPRPGEKHQGNLWAERFEVMIAGLEICDTYTENTDAALQKSTFEHEISKISTKKVHTPYDFDWEFVEALEHGLPDCSGNALGIDRLVMFFGNYDSILDIAA